MPEVEINHRIPCYACGEDIHIDDLGGLMNIDGKTALFHKNIVCLIEMSQHIKEATSE